MPILNKNKMEHKMVYTLPQLDYAYNGRDLANTPTAKVAKILSILTQ